MLTDEEDFLDAVIHDLGLSAKPIPGEFSAMELSQRITSPSYATIARRLNRLVAQKVLRRRESGNFVFYSFIRPRRGGKVASILRELQKLAPRLTRAGARRKLHRFGG